VFGDPTSTIDPLLKIDPLDPPATFVYQSSFLINLVIEAPVSSYSNVNNTSPFLVPMPSDINLYVGEPFVKNFGQAFDNENNAVRVTPFLGNA
jgi:hypothetical protein